MSRAAFCGKLATTAWAQSQIAGPRGVSPAEVFKILVLPPVVVGGGFLTLMYADVAGGRSGWTLALVVLATTAGLTWLILQV